MTLSRSESANSELSAGGNTQRSSRRKVFGGSTKAKLKGFITGKSRKERQASSMVKDLSHAPNEDTKNVPEMMSLSSAPSTDSRFNDLDMETVYGMELDNVSMVSENPLQRVPDSPSRGSNPGVDIVLLLMDNETKRFELLQVDVDSPSACVKDILVKIPDHATEPSLKFQTFGIVCDRHGKVMDTEKSLAEFFSVLADASNADIHHTFLLLAVTSNNQMLTGTDCGKLAKPILTHPKISNMLNTLGVKDDETRMVTFQNNETVVNKEFATIIEAKEIIQSTPITPETTASSTINEETLSSTIEEPPSSPTIEEVFIPFVPSKTNIDKVSSTSSFLMFTLFFGFVSMIFYSTLVQVHSVYSSAPLTKEGDILVPGSWRSQCGLFHLLPSEVVASVNTPYEQVNNVISTLLYKVTSRAYCPADSTLSVFMNNNGTLEVYRNNQIIYALVGQLCTSSSASHASECISGAKVTATGSIVIGGLPPLQALFYEKEPIMNKLQSWPFGSNIVLPTPFSSEEGNTPLQISHTKGKVGGFPEIKIVWPWEKKKKNNPKVGDEGFKFPWENMKVTWPWEK